MRSAKSRTWGKPWKGWKDYVPGYASASVLLPHQVMEVLGGKISHRTLRRLVENGELPPPFRVGGTNRWYPWDIARYLALKAA